MKKLLAIFTFISCAVLLQAQNVKPFIKAGQEFFDNGKYNEAIEQFTKAIDLQPANADNYVKRARAYERLNEKLKAAEDYDNAITFDIKEEDWYNSAAKLYFQLQEFPKTIERCNASLDLSMDYEILAIKVDALLKNKNYSEALIDAKMLVLKRSTDQNYYRFGIASEASEFEVDALKAYQNAIDKNKRFYQAYTALANLQFKTKNSMNALNNVNEAIKINPKYTEAYRVRAKIYGEQLKMAEVINDISTVILLEPEVDENYFQRGLYYQQFAQHPNAINDFSKVIALSPTRADAYFKRATSFEQINSYKEAIKDYETLKKLNSKDPNIEDLLAKSQVRLFELNREEDKPIVSITSPSTKWENTLNVPKNAITIELKGTIKEKSALKEFTINGENIKVEKMEDGYGFNSNLTLQRDTFILAISDVYNNTLSTEYAILRTEIDTPDIKLMAPYASDNLTIFLDSQDPKIYIEGKIFDESLISSIYIDDMLASYSPQELNPTFQAYLTVTNKDRFTIKVVDKHGNQSVNTYNLNREGATIAQNNPMGKTWAIFIENSNYSNFANLEGPIKDVSLMKSALVKYNVNNLIHKKDMSKEEMERFFSIELRDLVRSNNVKSLLIWYAGHGKFLNQTGYWVAVDSKRDDEFTYFNISSLKSALNTYTSSIDHTLVITDACESGPSFYQAMRSELKPRSCGDLSAKMKSSQVFSSAGYELAVDNSQFTKTFANTLINSQDACLPIESIVQRVTTAVQSNNQQKPLFGKIAGLGDEDGTFFFIAK